MILLSPSSLHPDILLRSFALTDDLVKLIVQVIVHIVLLQLPIAYCSRSFSLVSWGDLDIV